MAYLISGSRRVRTLDNQPMALLEMSKAVAIAVKRREIEGTQSAWQPFNSDPYTLEVKGSVIDLAVAENFDQCYGRCVRGGLAATDMENAHCTTISNSLSQRLPVTNTRF